MFNKRAEIDNLKLKVHKLKLDVSDRDREISRLNSGIKELSKYYSERCSKPFVSADMATDVKVGTQMKIHELPEWQQAIGAYAYSYTCYYNVFIDDPETLALLSKPNTRLAIIEDDEDA